MFPVHCKLNEFDLDKFINECLYFSRNLHLSSGKFAVVRTHIAEFEDCPSVVDVHDRLNDGETLFFFYHERFTDADDVVQCVDGEIKNDFIYPSAEDYNYGFLVSLENEELSIRPAILNDPDYKDSCETTVSECLQGWIEDIQGWCGMFDYRMQQFVKKFKVDYRSHDGWDLTH